MDRYQYGGLVLDHQKKESPRNYYRQKRGFKVGDMVRCKAERFKGQFRGYIIILNTNSAVIQIENCMKGDNDVAREKQGLAVVRYKNMSVMERDS